MELEKDIVKANLALLGFGPARRPRRWALWLVRQSPCKAYAIVVVDDPGLFGKGFLTLRAACERRIRSAASRHGIHDTASVNLKRAWSRYADITIA
jgi:hypothetical protein